MPTLTEPTTEDGWRALLSDLKVLDNPQQAEWDRYALDPAAWICECCRAFDPRNLDNPYSPFILSPLQVRAVHLLETCDRERRGSLWEKSRDSGATFIAAFYALHCWIFRSGDTTGFGSLKLDQVDSLGNPNCIFEKIRMTYRGLPEWQKPKDFVWSKHSTLGKLVNPNNGSTIIGEGGDNVGRGGRSSRYFLDEAAHVEHPKLIDASLSQNTNVRHDISTPRGLNEFYLRRQSGLVDVFRMHWIDDPRKWQWEATNAAGQVVDKGEGRHPYAPVPTAYELPKPDANGITILYPWYERERKKPEFADQSVMAQEVDIDYVGSGRARFNRKWLVKFREYIYPENRYREDWEPIRVEEDRWAGVVTTFTDPMPGRQYALLVDTAKGLTASGTADFSVAHVFDLDTCEQVCHYRGQMSEIEYAMDLYALGMMYNVALIVVETPGPGEAVLSMLATQPTPYPRVYSYWDDDVISATSKAQGRSGLPMTSTTKPEGDGKLASMIEDAAQGFPHSIALRHVNTIEECIHYTRLRGSECGAEAGSHDDEVACLRLLAMIWARYTTRGKIPIRHLRMREPDTATGSENIAVPGFESNGFGGFGF